MARGRGGVPPIVTVLITISAIVAASLVAWFLYSTTRGATQTPVLEVTSAYFVGSPTTTKTLYVNVRNLGPLDITSITFPSKPAIQCALGATNSTTPTVSPTVNQNSPLPVGGSFVVQAQMNTVVKDGDSCTITLQVATSSGTHVVTLGFRVTVP